jgi:large subunit ribosomal protein L9
MIVDAIKTQSGVEVDRHQVDMEPIRTLGEKKARIRLTVDLMPEIKILVHREGEAVETAEEPKAESHKKVKPKAEAQVEEAPVEVVPPAAVITEEAPVEEVLTVEAPADEAPAAEAPEVSEEK